MYRYLFVLLATFIFLVPCIALAQAQDCASLYRQKKFRKAGACFLRKARKMGPTSRLKSAAKLTKGGILRSAAISLMKAAKQARPRDAAYLRERAMYTLRSYYKDNLCASASRCQAAKRQTKKLYGQIKYGQLQLVFPQTPVAIQLVGYRYSRTRIIKRSPWRTRLRPGTYKLSLIGLGQRKEIASILLKPSSTQRWTYKPNIAPRAVPPVVRRTVAPRVVARRPTPRVVAKRPTPRVVRRPAPSPRISVVRRPVVKQPIARRPVARLEPRSTPTKPKTKIAKTTVPSTPPSRGIPAGALVSYIAGAIVLAAGIGVGGYAIYAYSEGTRQYNEPTVPYSEADALRNGYDTTMPISIALISAGGVALLVGGILHATAKPNTQQSTKVSLTPQQHSDFTWSTTLP